MKSSAKVSGSKEHQGFRPSRRESEEHPRADAQANPHLSLAKAFTILEVLASRSSAGVTEVADSLNLEKSGVSRLLKSLARLGYAVQDGARGPYRLGPRVLVLAQHFLSGDRLIHEAGPILRELAESARATSHLGIAVEGRTLVAAKEPSPEEIQVVTRVGAPIAPHASALGKVLLSGLDPRSLGRFLTRPLERYTEKTIADRAGLERELEKVRRRGYAFECEEEHRGVGCIGAPVRDSAGRIIAAISVAGPLKGTPFRLDPAHLNMVLAAAAKLSARMSSGAEPRP